MSGHNRWTKIKRQKEAMGATKGKSFTKVIKEITVAARDGGGDPASNPSLRSAIAAAKAVNLPKENLERAIKRGTGELEGQSYDEVTYEGYGPGGVAIIVECLTDNRNRTAAEVRHHFSKGGGTMGDSGAVAWMFERRGLISFERAGRDEEAAMELAMEVGADDVVDGEDVWELRVEASELHVVAGALEAQGIEPQSPHLAWLPKNTVEVEGEVAAKLLRLIGLLEDDDDVRSVWSNFEMDDAALEAAS